MNSSYSSIFHNKIDIKSNGNLKLNYGKKYGKSKNVKKTVKKAIIQSSKYFKDNSVIKISSDKHITICGLSRENNNPIYPGDLYIYKTNDGLVVVNELNIEDYVERVVSSEIGEKYPLEAMKAQAVCARTYILKRIDDEKYLEFDGDADDSVAYQVYNRINPGKKSKKAAKETKGQILTHGDELVNTYFFSTSCGYTTDYRIWGKEKMKYLQSIFVGNESNINIEDNNEFWKFIKGKPEAYEKKCPFYRWSVVMSLGQIKYSIENNLNYNIGEIEKIEINKRNSGGIVASLTIYGSEKQVSITNQNNIRKALSPYYVDVNLGDGSKRRGMQILPSAFIALQGQYEKGKLCGYKIYGGGYGHGSGMSQNGARLMAEQGKKYQEILNFFYKNTAIEIMENQ